MTTRSRDLALGLAATTLLLTGLVGCSDDDDPGASPTPSSDSPSETETEPTDDPTDEPTEPAVEPATGPRVVTERFSFRAPEGWVVTGPNLPFVGLERDPGNKIRLAEPHGIISVTVLPSGRSFTLEQEARRNAEGERQADIDLDGERAYHFSESDRLSSDESFGLWREPFESISIRFGTFGTTRAEREAMVASVLATWEWRS